MTSRHKRARYIDRQGFGQTRLPSLKAHPYAVAGTIAVGALVVSALVNRHFTNKAERDNPPTGRFVEVDGVRLHYVERGSGEPLVLLMAMVVFHPWRRLAPSTPALQTFPPARPPSRPGIYLLGRKPAWTKKG